MASPTQVLIVGAGPTGLFLACELGRHGVPCRIVDRCPGPSGQARATTIHSRTLEILESVELVDTFLAAGVPCHTVGTYTPTMEVLSRLNTADLDSPFPLMLSLAQSQTEQILTGRLGDFGTAVEWGVELRGFVQDDAGVSARLAHASGTEERLRAAYLVGCDGAHSTVRHTLGVAFTGTDYPTDFVVADVRIDWRAAIPDREFCFFFGPEGQMFYAPLAGGRALITGDLGKASPEGSPAGEPSLDELQALVDARSPGGVLRDPAWRGYFQIHLRQAERYQVGRVFLAGDAAHVQSPAGGQGMNTGLQDAHNLGWKLGLVWHGRAPAAILDSYHPERHRAGHHMLVLNDYLYHTEMESHVARPVPAPLRRELALVLAGQEVIQQRLKRAVAELDINYRHSPLVEQHRTQSPSPGGGRPALHGWHDFGAAPHAGDRAVDAGVLRYPSRAAVRFSQVRRGTRHHLVLFAGLGATPATHRYLEAVADEVTRSHGALVDTHLVTPHEVPPPEARGVTLIDPRGELHHRYGATIESIYLIRPDGYVGFRSQPADGEALRSFLARIFGAVPPAAGP